LGVIGALVQDTTGFKAGWVQLITDGVIFSVALFLFPASVVGIFLASARGAEPESFYLQPPRDRYIAT